MKPKYKRVLLKLSGELLLPQGEAYGVSFDGAAKFAEEIEPLVGRGVEVGIVIGGGNIFRGAPAAAGANVSQAQADTMGMLATVINGLAIQESLEKKGIATNFMTSIAMQNVAEPFVRRQAMNYLSQKRVVIFGGGTGSPFFSTDTAAALRALEVDANVILKGTKVDGVYSADPKKIPSATRFESLTYLQVLDKGLKVMDSTAISMCMDHKLPIVVFNVFVPGNLEKVVMGAKMGTVVYG